MLLLQAGKVNSQHPLSNVARICHRLRASECSSTGADKNIGNDKREQS